MGDSTVGEEPGSELGPWEYLLFAEELERGLARLNSDRRTFSMGVYSTSGPIEVDLGLAAQHVVESLRLLVEIVRPIHDLWSTPSQLHIETFGAPGEPGDPAAIRDLARRLTQVFSSVLEWAVDLRALAIPERARPVYWAFSNLVEAPLAQFERFVENFGSVIREVDRAFRTGRPYPPSATLDLTLTFDRGALATANAALDQMLESMEPSDLLATTAIRNGGLYHRALHRLASPPPSKVDPGIIANLDRNSVLAAILIAAEERTVTDQDSVTENTLLSEYFEIAYGIPLSEVEYMVDLVEILLAVEDQYGIVMPVGELEGLETIGQVLDLVWSALDAARAIMAEGSGELDQLLGLLDSVTVALEPGRLPLGLEPGGAEERPTHDT